LGERGSSAGEGTLAAAAAADNNMLLPAAENGDQSGAGEELGTRRKSPRLNANTGEKVADGEEKSDGTEGEAKLDGVEGEEEDSRPPEVGDIMSIKYTKEGECEGVVCEVTQDTLSLAFVDKEGNVEFVDKGIPLPEKDLKYVTDKNRGIKKGTVPEGWEEWKPPESDTDTEEESNDGK